MESQAIETTRMEFAREANPAPGFCLCTVWTVKIDFFRTAHSSRVDRELKPNSRTMRSCVLKRMRRRNSTRTHFATGDCVNRSEAMDLSVPVSSGPHCFGNDMSGGGCGAEMESRRTSAGKRVPSMSTFSKRSSVRVQRADASSARSMQIEFRLRTCNALRESRIATSA